MNKRTKAANESVQPLQPLHTLAAIGPIARSSVVDAVADRLRGEILAGRLEAGSRLPSEREFSLALGVNRLTLRSALARLEALGLLVTRHGSPTIVASWRERAGLDTLASLLGSSNPAEASWVELLTSMLEVRRILASEAIALAAERHTESDLRDMQARADEQVARVHDPLAFARGDIAFQRVVVRAARNVGLELLLNTFARFPDDLPLLVGSLYDRCEEALQIYPMLMGLVRAGNPSHARELVRTFLEANDVEWQKRHFANAKKAGQRPQAVQKPNKTRETKKQAKKGGR